MVYADLHVHTTNSDGRLDLEAVPAAARDAGVSVVGITDHDRHHPELTAPVVERAGVQIVHGIELRAATDEGRIDLLGYGLDPTPALRRELDRLGRDRRERAARIRDCLESRLGIELDLSIDTATGRPHLARAVLAHPGSTYESVGAVFRELIGDGRPCYVPRAVPGFERARSLLGESTSIVSLAHPFRYDDPEAALKRCESLDAVERYYPYDRPVEEKTIDAAIEAHDLLVTGGSDSHGRTLGDAGLDRSSYEALGLPAP